MRQMEFAAGQQNTFMTMGSVTYKRFLKQISVVGGHLYYSSSMDWSVTTGSAAKTKKEIKYL
jgi:hypothetical protein